MIDCKVILAEFAPFIEDGVFILIDTVTNTVIGKVRNIDEAEIYSKVSEALGDDVHYRVVIKGFDKNQKC
jgi:hypothetical protein